MGRGSPPCQTLYLMQRTKGAGHPLTYPPPPPPPSHSPLSFGLVESNSSRDIRVEGSSEKIDPGLPTRFLQDLYSWLHLPIASHSSEHSMALHACTPLWSWWKSASVRFPEKTRSVFLVCVPRMNLHCST